MPHIRRGAAELHYESAGSGVPLVLINGLGRDSRHWLGFTGHLTGRHQVITLDLRGMGASRGGLSWTSTVRDFALDIGAVLDATGLNAAHVFGLSLGGMVALAMGLYCPERVRSLTVVNSSVGGTGPTRITPAGIVALVRAAMSPGRADALLEPLLLSPSFSEGRAAVRAGWNGIHGRRGLPVGAALRQLVALERFRRRPLLSAIQAPVQIVYGTDDALVAPRHSRLIHEAIPGSRLIGVERGGHELTLDQPARLAAIVSEFIAGCESKGSRAA